MSVNDLIETQHQLEAMSVGLGVDRYRGERPMPWAKGDPSRKEETEMSPGRALLKRSVEPLATAIDEALDKAVGNRVGGFAHASMYLIQDIEPEVCAYVTARRAINGASAGDSLQAVAVGIGTLLEEHLTFKSFAKAEPGLFRHFEQKANKSTTARYKRARLRGGVDAAKRNGADITETGWTEWQKLKVGEKLIDLFIQTSNLVELSRQTIGKHKTLVILQPTAECAEWLEKQHARCELLSPLHLPMVVQPDPWTTPFDGGYLNKRLNRLDMVKTRNRQFKKELEAIDMPEVYDALNSIQNVRWAINQDVLKVMREVWDSGDTLGDLPPREDLPMPTKPNDIETNPVALKHWKAEAAKVHEDNAKLRGKRLGLSQKIWMAEEFSKFEAIWFPHQYDFRGRVYPAVPFLNPQGDDPAKALLCFADGIELGDDGVRWLKIHTSNLFGVDKVSMDERVSWFDQHRDQIIDSGNNPLDGSRFWATADSPYCALAVCLEWAAAYRMGDPRKFKSRIPVAMDGSCSGLQHFSAMLRDPIGGKAVNLVPSEKPQDIYKMVAGVAEQIVMDDTSNPLGAVWEGKIIRSIAKRPCMTLTYGATRFGFQEQIQSELKKLDRQHGAPYLNGTDNHEAATYLSYVINDAIGQVVVAARAAMDWLQDTARLAAQEGLPVYWTTPAGFPVLQEYRKITAKKIELFFAGQRTRLSLAEETHELNVRRQANGISPNFVHSLDASHLMKTVNACSRKGLIHFAFIHDSYGTHAANIPLLNQTLREAFVEQYSGDVLGTFRQEMMDQMPKALAEQVKQVPPFGTLDINAVLDSEYFFA